MNDGEQICRLAEGRILDWRGLRPFRIEDAPACLGPRMAQDWLAFNRGHAAFHLFRSGPVAPDVWLFTFDGESVELVELFSLPSSVVTEEVLSALGEPDLLAGYPLAAQLQRPLRQPGEELRESIFGDRGLALLSGHAPGETARLVRVRGFEAMPAQNYYERFVELPQVNIFQP